VRPSVIFGPEDQFINRFATLARFMPILPLFAGGETRFHPVYVGDVAKAVALAVEGDVPAGSIYELGGPEIKTLREIVQFVCDHTGRKRWLLPIPTSIAHYLALALECADQLSFGLMPDVLMTTRDQIKLLGMDNVVSDAAQSEGRTLHGMGIVPESMESIVPPYLVRYRKAGQYERQRLA
jgi:NADH dehydrogenase